MGTNKPWMLYSVYRKSDDRLMILDGNVHECAKVLNIQENTFRTYLADPSRSPYVITKCTMKDIERDLMEE